VVNAASEGVYWSHRWAKEYACRAVGVVNAASEASVGGMFVALLAWVPCSWLRKCSK
jgi:hypothetical protein